MLQLCTHDVGGPPAEVEPDEAEGGPPEDDLEEPTTALLGGVPVVAEGGPPAEEEPTTALLGDDMQEASCALSIAISFRAALSSLAGIFIRRLRRLQA